MNKFRNADEAASTATTGGRLLWLSNLRQMGQSVLSLLAPSGLGLPDQKHDSVNFLYGRQWAVASVIQIPNPNPQ